MKIIFVLALFIVVGTQAEDSSEDDNMSDGDDMSGEDDNMGNNSKSGIPKKLLQKITNICVDLKVPAEFMENMFKECWKEEAKKSDILENILDGNFPDKQKLANLFESLEMCKHRLNGINDMENDLTSEKIEEIFMYDKWIGRNQDKEEMRDTMVSCFETSQGSGYEKLMDSHQCIADYYVEKCRQKDDHLGALMLIFIKLSTLHEDSKCAPVKVSEEMKQITNDCLEEAKASFKESSQTSTDPALENVPKEFVKSLNLLMRFSKEFIIEGFQQCVGKKTGTFDFETSMSNMTAFAEIISKFEGWDGIEQERDEVYQAFVECGREYEDSRERDNDSYDEKIKDLMEDNEDFDACITPKFAKICGYNNELSTMIDFSMNPEFMGKLYEIFKELGGKEIEDLINLLKGMLQKFKEQ